MQDYYLIFMKFLNNVSTENRNTLLTYISRQIVLHFCYCRYSDAGGGNAGIYIFFIIIGII